MIRQTVCASCFRIACLAVIVSVTGCTTLNTAQAPIFTVEEVVDPRYEAFLQEMVHKEHFSGVALVARNDQVIHTKGYGLASADSPNKVSTAFHIGSITKQFTATAIMQLSEAGVVELDQSINKYLPERYTTPKWNSVTVHHLLSHSSGITDYAVERDYYEVIDGFCHGDTVDGMVREAMGKELEFEPGTRFSYSNIGFTLLGFIVENQSASPFEKYVEEHILEPMHLYHSRFHSGVYVPASDEASGHRWSDERNTHVPDDVISLPVTTPDGALVMTLGDFLAWIRIFRGENQNILSQESIEKMTSVQIPFEEGNLSDGYGYGLVISGHLIGHGGYIVGFRSHFVFDRDTGTLVILFTNNTANDPQRIASGFRKISSSLASE